MKGILIVTLAMCLGACASHPEKTGTVEPTAAGSGGTTLVSSNRNNHPPTRKVFKDDYERLLVQTGSSKRPPVVLGRKKFVDKSD